MHHLNGEAVHLEAPGHRVAHGLDAAQALELMPEWDPVLVDDGVATRLGEEVPVGTSQSEASAGVAGMKGNTMSMAIRTLRGRQIRRIYGSSAGCYGNVTSA